MITIVYSTQKDAEYNNEFRTHLLDNCGLANPQIIEFVNNGEYSLSELYNKGINMAENDIIVCMHNDIRLNDKNWGVTLLNEFNNNPDYGIIGMAGTCNFPTSGVYWEGLRTNMAGVVHHRQPNGEINYSQYSIKKKELIQVISVDGLFISFNRNKIKHKFDETGGKFHFYDHSFCLPNYLDGVKIGVTTAFDILHYSIGIPNKQFFIDKDAFVEKYKNYLPLDLKPTKVLVNKVDDTKKIGGIGKTAVIIPTKGKTYLLFDCINSFIEQCGDTIPYEVFVADTGSTDDEIAQTKAFIEAKKELVKINLIQYDYYNFAKINNDVVKNHVGKEFQFLLFSNNDIKLLNNVLYGMVALYKKYTNVGTIGVRMHYANNTIQHNGMLCGIDGNYKIVFTHLNVGGYYIWKEGIFKVFGNTAGLMMISKTNFKKCGYFSEKYDNCFEDVELNAKCLLMGLDNYSDSELVAYHYESVSRAEDPEFLDKVNKDYDNHLYPFIQKNIRSLVNKKIIYKI